MVDFLGEIIYADKLSKMGSTYAVADTISSFEAAYKEKLAQINNKRIDFLLKKASMSHEDVVSCLAEVLLTDDVPDVILIRMKSFKDDYLAFGENGVYATVNEAEMRNTIWELETAAGGLL